MNLKLRDVTKDKIKYKVDCLLWYKLKILVLKKKHSIYIVKLSITFTIRLIVYIEPDA